MIAAGRRIYAKLRRPSVLTALPISVQTMLSSEVGVHLAYNVFCAAVGSCAVEPVCVCVCARVLLQLFVHASANERLT